MFQTLEIKIASIAFIAFFCTASACFGQATWNHWHIQSQSLIPALSNHTITLIKRTSPREVWIASTEGIFLFDGLQTKRKPVRWRSNSELPIKRALEFARGSDGSTYLFTIEDGIFRIPSNKSHFELVADNNNDQNLSSIDAVTVSPKHNSALFIANGRVFSMLLGMSAISEVVFNTSIETGPPKALLSSRDGNTYVLFEDFVIRLVWQVDRFVPQKKLNCDLALPTVNTSSETVNGVFYITDTFGRLHSLRISNTECVSQQLPELVRAHTIDARVNSVDFLPKTGALALSTDNGLTLLEGDSAYQISTQNSQMRSDEIVSVEEVSEGNIVVGSFRGVMHATKSPFMSVTRFPSERRPTVTAIASAKNVGTFIASKKGLYREFQNENEISFGAFDLKKKYSSISALEITERSAWIGFQDGKLLHCDLGPQTDTCEGSTEIRLDRSPITAISTSSALIPAVLVTTLEGKAFIVKRSGDELENSTLFDLGTKNLKLLSVKAGHDMAWFIDFQGVRAVSLDAIKAFSQGELQLLELGKLVPRPWAMTNSAAAVYFATPGGDILRYNTGDSNEELVQVSSTSINESIFSIEVDTLGRPWAATSSGIWLKHSDGTFRREIETQGIDSIAVDYGASHTDANGTVYFGGTGGLISIRSPEVYPHQLSGAVVLTKVKLNEVNLTIQDRSTGDDRLVEVKSLRAKIEFEFSIDHILASQPATYQHKLEGFDKDWQDTGNINFASYQNLPPGNYVFKARGADSTGIWSHNEINLPIQVLPPLWRSWWALLSYLILALVVFAYLKRINDHNVANRERLKLAEEGSAAFARLEDDYQAQREANDRLLLRRAPSANALLNVIETALTAQLSNDDTQLVTSALAQKLQTLRSVHALTDRTFSQERTDLHAVTQEISAELAASNEVAARAIISNDVCQNPVPLEHAAYLSLVIQELLELSITGRQFEAFIDPLVFINMKPPARTESGEYSYTLYIEDSGQRDADSNSVEELLPLTFHLIESGGGEISDDYDAGNIVNVKLLFPANTAI